MRSCGSCSAWEKTEAGSGQSGSRRRTAALPSSRSPFRMHRRLRGRLRPPSLCRKRRLHPCQTEKPKTVPEAPPAPTPAKKPKTVQPEPEAESKAGLLPWTEPEPEPKPEKKRSRAPKPAAAPKHGKASSRSGLGLWGKKPKH